MKLMSTIRYRETANNITERSGYTQYAKIGRLPNGNIINDWISSELFSRINDI